MTFLLSLKWVYTGAKNYQSSRNTSSAPGITMHQFPLDLKIGAQWVKFVQRHRVYINEPTNKYTSPCSVHFKVSCYPERPQLSLQGTEDKQGNEVSIKGVTITNYRQKDNYLTRYMKPKLFHCKQRGNNLPRASNYSQYKFTTINQLNTSLRLSDHRQSTVLFFDETS